MAAIEIHIAWHSEGGFTTTNIFSPAEWSIPKAKNVLPTLLALRRAHDVFDTVAVHVSNTMRGTINQSAAAQTKVPGVVVKIDSCIVLTRRSETRSNGGNVEIHVSVMTEAPCRDADW